MIDLNTYNDVIRDFIAKGISDFKSKEGEPSQIGIYCSPWIGWITINFNLSVVDSKSAPDFDFVEYDMIDFEDWLQEYEAKEANYMLDGELFEHNSDLGDEHLNEFFFKFLKPIVKDLQVRYKIPFLLQFLGSAQRELIN